jgi:hypothetical protein
MEAHNAIGGCSVFEEFKEERLLDGAAENESEGGEV